MQCEAFRGERGPTASRGLRPETSGRARPAPAQLCAAAACGWRGGGRCCTGQASRIVPFPSLPAPPTGAWKSTKNVHVAARGCGPIPASGAEPRGGSRAGDKEIAAFPGTGALGRVQAPSPPPGPRSPTARQGADLQVSARSPRLQGSHPSAQPNKRPKPGSCPRSGQGDPGGPGALRALPKSSALGPKATSR